MSKHESTQQYDKIHLLIEIRYLYGLNENVNDLISLYFDVNQEKLDSLESELFKLQQNLVDFVFENEFLKRYQPYWKYRRSFLKHIISIIENYNQEVNELLFENYIALINDPISSSNQELQKYFIVHFEKDNDIHFDSQQKPVIIEQYASIIAEGTTGLHVWPAAFKLMEYLKKNKHLTFEKNVLELGAGLGLLGLKCVQTGKPKHFVFTDSHSLVLNQLEKNVLYNFEKNSISTKINRQNFDTNIISLVRLDWTDYTDCELFTQLNDDLNIDLIIASDIIFDPELMPHLAKTLSYIWKKVNKRDLEFIIASTIRNQNTYDRFVECLIEENFEMKRLEFFDSSRSKQEQGCIEILKITKKFKHP